MTCIGQVTTCYCTCYCSCYYNSNIFYYTFHHFTTCYCCFYKRYVPYLKEKAVTCSNMLKSIVKYNKIIVTCAVTCAVTCTESN